MEEFTYRGMRYYIQRHEHKENKYKAIIRINGTNYFQFGNDKESAKRYMEKYIDTKIDSKK
ncbi:hypothetical protein R9X47_25125 [Wukongibacter baidiensis]|uniref:hypothetical protein n=1 Tax=Wukongibacter baidiensis TaxID=1723361 RepID=UPI003D7F6F19